MQTERREEKTRGEGGRSRGESRAGAGFARLFFPPNVLQLLYPLSSPLSHPLSSWAPWALARQLIPLTFYAVFSAPSVRQAWTRRLSVGTHNGLRWMRDGGGRGRMDRSS